MTPNVLDCTLRDGGYWTAWNFEPALVQAYLQAMRSAEVHSIELGFRSLENAGFRGPFAFTTDAFLEQLNLPDELRLSVMVNASELVGHADGVQATLQILFRPAAASRVAMVRIAARRREVAALGPTFRWLRERGYATALNLMQVSTLRADEAEALGRKAQELQPDVLYLADSLGGLRPETVPALLDAFRQTWLGDLGIHAHDNLGTALLNTLAAWHAGARWLDGTVLGMGRGPGNTRTEHLLLETQSANRPLAAMAPLIQCLSQHFRPLQARHEWGTNPYYYMAGLLGIHPTYVQKMLTDSRFCGEDILAVLGYLRDIGACDYDQASLLAGRTHRMGAATGSWRPADRIQGRDVLILGPGPGAVVHRRAIEVFIRQHAPFVIGLNTIRNIDPDCIDVRAACHPIRLLADAPAYGDLPQPLVTPMQAAPEALLPAKILDFGLTVRAGTFEFGDFGCVVPSTLVLAYALAIATSGRGRRVLLAGFDGFGSGDPRQTEVLDILAAYQAQPQALPLLAVTPTTYNLPACSIYGPL